MKLLSFFHVNISICYNKNVYAGFNDEHDTEMDTILRCLDILNKHPRKEKYSLIFDYACDYLDNEFLCHNWCDFKKNMCVNNRNKPKEYQTGSCCTRTSSKKDCIHFNKEIKRCGIKCLSCKLFTCDYLKDKGIKYTANKVPYLKYFLSPRQKLISNYSFFKDKDEVIKRWLRFYKLP